MSFEQIRGHMGTGQDLEGQRGDESTGTSRHHDADIGRFTAKQPQEPDGLVGRNTPETPSTIRRPVREAPPVCTEGTTLRPVVGQV